MHYADIDDPGRPWNQSAKLAKYLPSLDVSPTQTEADCAAGAADIPDKLWTVAAPPKVIFGTLFPREDPPDSTDAMTPSINNVPVRQNLSVTFSEAIDLGSLRDSSGAYDSNSILLTGGSGSTSTNVSFSTSMHGSSLVINPEQPLEHAQTYTLTLGTGVTDLAGNALAAPYTIKFATTAYVPSTDASTQVGPGGAPLIENVAETSPFLLTLYPGLPCALDPASGNFRSGGDVAGYCAGVATNGQGSGYHPGLSRTWNVFDLPANRGIHAVFSKPIKQDSVTLADGCLTAPAGGATLATQGSIVVQRMDGAGGCLGTVDGGVMFPHPGDPYARKFVFKPTQPWQDSQRYWLVICGTKATVCTTGDIIVDRDNGDPATTVEVNNGFPIHDGRLNTNPFQGTGTRQFIGTGGTIVPGGGMVSAAGGPALIMPFDGAPASPDQFFVAITAPITDINGNAYAEGVDGENSAQVSRGEQIPFAEQERRQLANSVTIIEQAHTSAGPLSGNVGGSFDLPTTLLAYQAGAQPQSVGPVTNNCQVPQAVADMINPDGDQPARCAKITLYPGGLFTQTVPDNAVLPTLYGRTLVQIAGVAGPNGTTVPQTGYIVDRCHGSFFVNKTPASNPATSTSTGFPQFSPDDFDLVTDLPGAEYSYDYSPCVVLRQIVNVAAPDVDNVMDGDRQDAKSFPQQRLVFNLVGPLEFMRNGRIVIRLLNTNVQAFIGESIAPLFGIRPGDVRVQLVGPAIHGGSLAAFKTQ